MSEAEESVISRRNFLRAAGALGVSGALLGTHVSRAQGQEDRGGDVGSAGPSTARTGEMRRPVAWTPPSSTHPSS
jgi:hypothetical protein